MGLFTLCSYLKTKESYHRWVTRRLWEFRHQISKAKYPKRSQNVGRKYQEASGEHCSCAWWLWNGSYESLKRKPSYPENLNWRLWMLSGWALSEDLVMFVWESWNASSPIRHHVPNVKYPNKSGMTADSIPAVRHPEKVKRRKGDRLHVQGVGTPSPDDTERASLSGDTPSGFLKRTYGGAPPI